MRDVIIKLSLTEEQAAMFEGKTAMVVPLTDPEIIRLRELFSLTYGLLDEMRELLGRAGFAGPESRESKEMLQ